MELNYETTAIDWILLKISNKTAHHSANEFSTDEKNATTTDEKNFTLCAPNPVVDPYQPTHRQNGSN